jgi:hypothetical protein
MCLEDKDTKISAIKESLDFGKQAPTKGKCI